MNRSVRNKIFRKDFDILTNLNVKRANDLLEKNWLRWLGHLLRMETGKTANEIYQAKVDEKRGKDELNGKTK